MRYRKAGVVTLHFFSRSRSLLYRASTPTNSRHFPCLLANCCNPPTVPVLPFKPGDEKIQMLLLPCLSVSHLPTSPHLPVRPHCLFYTTNFEKHFYLFIPQQAALYSYFQFPASCHLILSISKQAVLKPFSISASAPCNSLGKHGER